MWETLGLAPTPIQLAAFWIRRCRFGGSCFFVAFLTRRRRNGDVHFSYRTERRQRFVELRGVAYDQYGEFVLVQVLCRGASYIFLSNFLDPGAIAFQVIRWISVELVRHAFAEHFLRRIKIENE